MLGTFLLFSILGIFVFTYICSYNYSNDKIFYNITIQFILICFALFYLIYLYVISDFSFTGILNNSNIEQQLVYKVCTSWSDHEGSFLFWITVLIWYSYSLHSSYKENKIYNNILQIISLFLIFIIFFSNPFLQSTFNYKNGSELNPALQDVALLIHPPILYLGLGSTFLLYILAVALPVKKLNSKDIISILKKYTSIGFIYLTLGIALGSWWAYYELGWGSFWFWDPVENVSLLPWIGLIGLYHSLYKTKNISRTNQLFCVFLFIVIIFGFFIVRSGLLLSVHSFALDLNRGKYLFLFVLVLLFKALFSFSKHKFLINYNSLKLITQITRNFILFNSIYISLGFFLIVFIGTYGPFLYNLLSQNTFNLDNNFFIENSYFFLTLIVLNFNFVNLFLLKSKGRIKFIYFLFPFLLISCIILYTNYSLYLINYKNLSIFILYITFVLTLYTTILTKKYKVGFAHLSFLLISLGILGTQLYSIEIVTNLKPGNIFIINNLYLYCRGIDYIEQSHFNSLVGNIFITNEYNEYLGTLFPEARYYYLKDIFIKKTTILSNLLLDLKITLLGGNYKDGWQLKIYYNPLINFIWLGTIFLLLTILYSKTETLYKKYNETT